MITLPTPCNEDFSKMTATEKGRFCMKCSTDTYDFRQMNNHEINRIIAENNGQLCGQFYHHQLNELNNEFKTWQKSSLKTLQHKFILALIMVFGFTLFSCEDDIETRTAVNQIQRIKIEPRTQHINEFLVVNEVDLIQYVENNVAPEPPEILEELHIIDCYFPEEKIEESNEPIEQEYVLVNSVVTAGIPVISREYVTYTQVIEKADSTENISEMDENIGLEFTLESNVFPNPSKGFATLQLNINQENDFIIEVYSDNGAMIFTVFNGKLSQGRSSFDLDLQDLQSGMYFVKIQTGEEIFTEKIIRVN